MVERKGIVVVDLDGTLCSQTSGGPSAYADALPALDVIRRINDLWSDGWTIVINTARGMNSLRSDVAAVEEIYRAITEKWLKDNRVCYDELRFGKPPGDYYVDDKALRPDELFEKDL